MMSLRKFTIAAAVCAASLAATPAMATITLVDASSIQGDNVLFNKGTQTGTLVTGHTQLGTLVNFTGTTTKGDVISANGGQARVEGDLDTITSQPNDTLGLTSLTFSLDSGGTFNDLEFNLFGATDGAIAFFEATDNLGNLFTFDPAGYTLTTGSNFFGFQGIDGQSISSFTITTSPGSIQDVRQIRLTELVGAGGVPEPATWAMMLLGFGLTGASMRRRKARLPVRQLA